MLEEKNQRIFSVADAKKNIPKGNNRGYGFLNGNNSISSNQVREEGSRGFKNKKPQEDLDHI